MKLSFLIFITALSLHLSAHAQTTVMGQMTYLRNKFVALKEPLEKNQFKRPLVLESQDTSRKLTGDIYAVVDYPLKKVSVELNNPDHWCDVLLLHFNTKYCHAKPASSGDGKIIVVNMGKKSQEELKFVPHIDFAYSAIVSTPEYFQIKLTADDGPLRTSDYVISLEGLDINNGKTFLHLTYSYSMNFGARMALLAYLKTVASSKVGFTMTGKGANGQVSYVGGVRGLVERNTMRYYLAIDSFLGAVNIAPPAVQLEHRLHSWFAATEQYPEQLHEMDKDEYLTMKRAENLRQKILQ